MLLAHMCKYCGQFTLLGYVNDYDEHFCSQECYEKYCNKNDYTYSPKDIRIIRNPLND
jgi:hypothetical protein